MNSLTALARRLGRKEWFSGVGRRLVPLDLVLQERSRGRLSILRLAGLPSLTLTVRGRRSGQPRTVPLLYVPYGADYVVVGSNWGQPHHPAWTANLLAHPEAVVRVRGHDVAVRARLVTGTERERLWREVVALWPAYDDYARRAGQREIRVFVLSAR